VVVRMERQVAANDGEVLFLDALLAEELTRQGRRTVMTQHTKSKSHHDENERDKHVLSLKANDHDARGSCQQKRTPSERDPDDVRFMGRTKV
jgi:hypothetical protein